MLTLVHPPRGGNGGSPPSRRKGVHSPSLSLTSDEARHLRAAARNVARQHFGSLASLGRALDIDPAILTRKRNPSPGLAVALWRLTGIPVEDMLRGKLEAAPTLAPLPGKDGAA